MQLGKIKGLRESYSFIKSNGLKCLFSNMEVAIRMYIHTPYLTIGYTCYKLHCREGTFCLKTSKKRSTMVKGKLNSLMILCTAYDNMLEMDFDHLIDKFAQ